MFDTPAVARQLTAGGVARDQAAAIAKALKSPAAAAIPSSIRRALQSDDQQPVPITDMQAAINNAIAALDRLERAVEGPAGRRSAAARPHSGREGRGPGRRGPHRVAMWVRDPHRSALSGY